MTAIIVDWFLHDQSWIYIPDTGIIPYEVQKIIDASTQINAEAESEKE